MGDGICYLLNVSHLSLEKVTVMIIECWVEAVQMRCLQGLLKAHCCCSCINNIPLLLTCYFVGLKINACIWGTGAFLCTVVVFWGVCFCFSAC